MNLFVITRDDYVAIYQDGLLIFDGAWDNQVGFHQDLLRSLGHTVEVTEDLSVEDPMPATLAEYLDKQAKGVV